MSSEGENNKAIVLRFLDLMDRHEFDRFDEVLSPDLRVHIGSENEMDRNAVEDLIRMFYDAFPDFVHEVKDIFAEGNRVVARALDRGTHKAEFGGIAPTGRTVSMGQIAIYRVANDKIVEIWEERDAVGLMQQLEAD